MRQDLPVSQHYPKEVRTIGDHLRTVRLDRKLSQLDVAKILFVTEDSVTGWELNRFTPTPKYIKGIVSFLGYVPIEWNKGSLGTRLHYARLISGLTLEQLAKHIGCDESNLRVIELDKRTPRNGTLEKLSEFIQSVF
ncbi:MAG: hypothetical protein POELPBGB_01346 [Bacteroidia bacterium]|nr:hypothetical protein [Bacteroidia bacterium]